MVGEAKGEGRSGYMRALCTFLLNFFVNLKWYKMKSINFSKIKIKINENKKKVLLKTLNRNNLVELNYVKLSGVL